MRNGLHNLIVRVIFPVDPETVICYTLGIEQTRRPLMDTTAIREEFETAARDAANQFFAEQMGGVDRGMCGFAWVTIYPKHKGNTRDGKIERRDIEALGFRKDWTGKAYECWNPSRHGAQNIETKEAGARAAAEVLKRYGFTAYAGSRLD
jgi:hypothetical protein